MDQLITKNVFDWTDKIFFGIGTNLPLINLKETENKLEVELVVPNVKKEDFKVEIFNKKLMISSEEEKEETRKKGNYVRKEFGYQSFNRSFYLPEYVYKSNVKSDAKMQFACSDS